MEETVNEELNSTPIPFFLLLPFFVVIIMAPFWALEPYKAVAAAPLSTLILSISFGFISDAVFP
jgi:hypothetical protein